MKNSKHCVKFVLFAGGNFNKGIAAQIVGGYKVVVTENPWHAFLVMNGSTTCGGSLISTRTVLTAGHCLYLYTLD